MLNRYVDVIYKCFMVKCYKELGVKRMITIGLTGWSDHPLIAHNRHRKLEDYARHFPFVEMDTSFYAIPSRSEERRVGKPRAGRRRPRNRDRRQGERRVPVATR